MASLSQEMQNFIEATKQCLGQCEEMLTQEREKRQALLNNDEKRIEQMLQTQQASYMQLESLEQKRIEAQKAAGFEGKTAQQILNEVQDEQLKQQLIPLFERLSVIADDLREQNRAALDIATTNLKMIEHLMPQAQPSLGRATYSPKTPGSSWTPGTSFEKKV